MLTASPVILGQTNLQLIFQTESLGEREIETAQLPQGSNLMNAPKIRVRGYFFLSWLLRHTDEPQRGRNSCLWLQSRSVLCRVDVLQS